MVTEAAQAAEQVELVGAHAQGRRIGGADHALIGAGHAPRQVLALPLPIGGDLGQQLGALNAVLGAVGLDVQRCTAQVAVIGQGVVDQLAQYRVLEHLAPVIDGRVRLHIALIGRPLWVVRGHRCAWALVVRGQRTATQQRSAQDKARSGHRCVSQSQAPAIHLVRPWRPLTPSLAVARLR
ncbi:hypothetical protein D3C80_1179470 [compost metagenome]